MTHELRFGGAEQCGVGRDRATERTEPSNSLVDMQKLVQVGGDITNQPGQEYLLINML